MSEAFEDNSGQGFLEHRHMNAVRVVKGSQAFVTKIIDKPRIRPGAIRVKIEAAFLPSYFEKLPGGGWLTPPRPFTPGQCAIGTILESADKNCGLEIGQRVYCDMYIQGRDEDADQAFIGCFGLNPASERHLQKWPNGTFAEEFVGPKHCFTRIPEGLDIQPAVLCRLGWFATAYAALRRGGFKAGMTVAINGAAGLLGTSAAVVALSMGAAKVRLIGRRIEVLHEVSKLDPRTIIEGEGDNSKIDFVLDCASGSNTAVTERLVARLSRYGALTFVGALTSNVTFDASKLMRNSNSLIGSFWFEHEDLTNVLSMISSGVIDLKPFGAVSFGLENIGAAMRECVKRAGGLTHVALVP